MFMLILAHIITGWLSFVNTTDCLNTNIVLSHLSLAHPHVVITVPVAYELGTYPCRDFLKVTCITCIYIVPNIYTALYILYIPISPPLQGANNAYICAHTYLGQFGKRASEHTKPQPFSVCCFLVMI